MKLKLNRRIYFVSDTDLVQKVWLENTNRQKISTRAPRTSFSISKIGPSFRWQSKALLYPWSPGSKKEHKLVIQNRTFKRTNFTNMI